MEAFWKDNGYMSDDHQSTLPLASVTRRDFLGRSSAAGVAPFLAEDVRTAGGSAPPGDRGKPNVVLIISDQFRWDCLGANGLIPLG